METNPSVTPATARSHDVAGDCGRQRAVGTSVSFGSFGSFGRSARSKRSVLRTTRTTRTIRTLRTPSEVFFPHTSERSTRHDATNRRVPVGARTVHRRPRLGQRVRPGLCWHTQPAPVRRARAAVHEKRRVAALQRRPAEARRYSPLDQINAANFSKLEVAWRFKTDNLGPFPEFKLEGTPLMVKGVLYATAGTRRSVIALDAKTGELIWSHSLREGKRAGGRAAPAVGPRRVVLDRRQGRRAHHLRHDGLPARRAECEDRRLDHLVRQGRHRRSESRRRATAATSRSISRPARSASTRRRPSPATWSSSAPSFREGGDRQDARQHQRAGPRVRRAHGQEALAVQHHPAARRVRQRHLGERLVGDQRQRRRVERDQRGRGARPRLPAGRDAHVGFLRRSSAREQSVRAKASSASI